MRGARNMLTGKRIGIIGCGNMGEAIIKGLLAKKIIPKTRVMISDAMDSRIVYLKHRFGVRSTDSETLAKKCNVIILAVKPQNMEVALNEVSGGFTSKKLLISVLAGVKTDNIKALSRRKVQVARVMPNMSALVGESISCVAYSKGVSKDNKRVVIRLFSALGDVVEVDEIQMDAVTAVSGSGPAYFFYLIEALTESAVALGIERPIAEKLAIKTAIGSTALLSKLKQTPHVLRHKITSKKGTTEAAMKVFDSKGFQGLVKDAVTAAYKKSRDLSGDKPK